MKPSITLIFAVFIFTVSVYASPNFNPSCRMDTTNQISLNELLNDYYNIKDALANSDALAAALRAGDFVNSIQNIDMDSLSDSEHKSVMLLQDTLTADAKNISQSKDLTKQRVYFALLSDNFYLLAKDVTLTSQPIYRDYCPMKKHYWLSNETKIRNPYYGKAMLSCGSIVETIK